MSKSTLTNGGLIFAFVAAIVMPLPARSDPGWIGKRVVPNKSKLTLTINGEAVDRRDSGIESYRVEQVDGPSLLLKAEGQGRAGWASADDVVPVDDAIAFFTAQIRAKPGDAFFHAARAWLWRDRGDFEQALSDFDQAISHDSKNAAHYRGRGLAWHSRKAYDRAIADFDRAISLDPKSAPALIARGASRVARKEFGQAIADFSEAIWLDPLAQAAYENRGRAWYAKKEFAKAIVDYNLAIKLDARNIDAYCNRGDAWVALRRFDKAVADFSQAVEIDKQNARAHASRAWIWCTCPEARFRDGKKAVESATLACELTAWKDAQMLEVLAAACAQTNDFKSAVNWQTRANALYRERGGTVQGPIPARIVPAE